MARLVLRDAIVAHLRDAGSDSISGVARALARLPGAPVHRLSIAGYLAALTDEGILKEVERPPSKHYQLADDGRQRTVWERVGQAAGALHLPAPDRAAAVVASLQQLLGRAIFKAELVAAGFPDPGRAVEILEASDEERRGLRTLFRDDGPTPLHIPRGDPLLQARLGAVSDASIRAIIRHLALDASGALSLLGPTAESKGTQSQLALGGRE